MTIIFSAVSFAAITRVRFAIELAEARLMQATLAHRIRKHRRLDKLTL